MSYMIQPLPAFNPSKLDAAMHESRHVMNDFVERAATLLRRAVLAGKRPRDDGAHEDDQARDAQLADQASGASADQLVLPFFAYARQGYVCASLGNVRVRATLKRILELAEERTRAFNRHSEAALRVLGVELKRQGANFDTPHFRAILKSLHLSLQRFDGREMGIFWDLEQDPLGLREEALHGRARAIAEYAARHVHPAMLDGLGRVRVNYVYWMPVFAHAEYMLKYFKRDLLNYVRAYVGHEDVYRVGIDGHNGMMINISWDMDALKKSAEEAHDRWRNPDLYADADGDEDEDEDEDADDAGQQPDQPSLLDEVLAQAPGPRAQSFTVPMIEAKLDPKGAGEKRRRGAGGAHERATRSRRATWKAKAAQVQ